MATITSGARTVHAPRGTTLSCKGWQQEAALRMLHNNLDPDVAERPDELIVYGGSGRAARSWPDFDRIVATLKRLEDDETLLVQSGRAVGVLKTHPDAPRVLISNSMLVPKWATWDEFRRLEALGLTMYGQMTAGSWIYIGTQGILQGTYETFAACRQQALRRHAQGPTRRHRRARRDGRRPAAGGDIQRRRLPRAEVDPSRIERRLQTKYLDRSTADIDEAIQWAAAAQSAGEAVSIGWQGNIADLLQILIERDITPDVLTDQTSAHDPLGGYVPNGMTYDEALALRTSDPKAYTKASFRTMADHMRAMLTLQRRGAITFDYGNNLRGNAQQAGVADAFDVPGFVPEYIRPLFCEGSGPFRWCAISGDPNDIHVTDQAVLDTFPEEEALCRWIRMAHEKVAFQGLPCRICWLKYGQRAKMGKVFNDLVRTGKVSAPIVIGRDHLDCGSVASPNRETEA
jgi:urocanate hydratase